MALPVYPIELVSRHRIASNTIQLNFKMTDEVEFKFEAGQFVSLRFEHNGENYKRSYSIANSPKNFIKTGIIEIAIGLIPGGKASEFFSAMPTSINGTCNLAGPVGLLTIIPELPRRIILAGTGTGVAPYRSMIPELKKALQKDVEIKIIMGTRYREDLFYVNEFQKLADEYANASFEVCLSREKNINNKTGEFHGYVQDRFKLIDLDSKKDIIYLCGNPAMIDDAVEVVKSYEFTNRQIKREKYNFSR